MAGNFNRASRLTRFTSGTGQLLVGGASVVIYGLQINGAGSSAGITLNTSAGVAFLALRINLNQSRSVNIPFLADLGVSLDVDSGVTIDILHSQPGA